MKYIRISLSICIILVFMLSGIFPQPVQAAGVRYAKPIASGTGNCIDWANACTLQTALTNAMSGDQIWVMAGLHKPTTLTTNRAATFQLKGGVAVYGNEDGMITQNQGYGSAGGSDLWISLPCRVQRWTVPVCPPAAICWESPERLRV